MKLNDGLFKVEIYIYNIKNVFPETDRTDTVYIYTYTDVGFILFSISEITNISISSYGQCCYFLKNILVHIN